MSFDSDLSIMPPSQVLCTCLDRPLTDVERKQIVTDAMAGLNQQAADACADLRRHIYTGEPLTPAGYAAARILGGHPWPASS